MKQHRSTREPNHHLRPSARGFTLIEVTLALVLGALVLSGVIGVFLAMNNVERTFAARYERTNELDITHTGFSRAMLNLQMQEADTAQVVRADDESLSSAGDEPEPRDRLILETDRAVEADSTGWVPSASRLSARRRRSPRRWRPKRRPGTAWTTTPIRSISRLWTARRA